MNHLVVCLKLCREREHKLTLNSQLSFAISRKISFFFVSSACSVALFKKIFSRQSKESDVNHIQKNRELPCLEASISLNLTFVLLILSHKCMS
jgi:hypothetical protein